MSIAKKILEDCMKKGYVDTPEEFEEFWSDLCVRFEEEYPDDLEVAHYLADLNTWMEFC